MKRQGVLDDLCRSLDCMEDEMRGLCRLFHRKEKPKHKDRCPSCCEAEKKCPEIPPKEFCPPCGRERPCCREEKGF